MRSSPTLSTDFVTSAVKQVCIHFGIGHFEEVNQTRKTRKIQFECMGSSAGSSNGSIKLWSHCLTGSAATPVQPRATAAGSTQNRSHRADGTSSAATANGFSLLGEVCPADSLPVSCLDCVLDAPWRMPAAAGGGAPDGGGGREVRRLVVAAGKPLGGVFLWLGAGMSWGTSVGEAVAAGR